MDVIDQLLAVSPRIALVLVLCVIGYYLKRSPIKNWLIPWLLIAMGGTAYPIIASVKNDDYTAQLVLANILLGILLGAASVGLHQIVRTIFPFLFPDKGQTELIKKNDVEEK